MIFFESHIMPSPGGDSGDGFVKSRHRSPVPRTSRVIPFANAPYDIIENENQSPYKAANTLDAQENRIVAMIPILPRVGMGLKCLSSTFEFASHFPSSISAKLTTVTVISLCFSGAGGRL